MKHFVVDKPNRPEIRFRSIDLLAQNLRAHIQRCPYNRLQDSVVSVVQVPRKSKIADLELSSVDEYIGGFEVPMHDIELVEVLESPHDVLQEGQSLILWQSFPAFEISSKVSLFAELSHYVHVVAGLVDVEQLHDVLMLKFLHYLDLAVDILEVVVVGEDSFVYHFDSSWSAVADEPAQEDGCVRALSKQMIHGVNVFLYLLFAFRQRLSFRLSHIRQILQTINML